MLEELREGIAFVRRTPRIAWSLTYLGIASSLIGVIGALGPGFATQILRLRAEDFFFIMGPAGLGAVTGILFLNGYGRSIPRRLLIDSGLVAMGITLIAIAAVKPVSVLVSPAVRPLQSNLPELLSPFVSLIAVVVVIAVSAGLVIASALAARVLQAIIGLSVVYVGFLAYRGWQLIRASLAAGSIAPEEPDRTPSALPFISVVVPAHNEAPVIADVVGDLLAQRYGSPPAPSFEVVVLDPGSDDGTGAIA